MKTKHSTFVAALAISAFALIGCSSKPQEQVVAQAPSATDKYKQEIAGLSQKAVTLRTIPAGDGSEPYVLAVENTTFYDGAVLDLKTRIVNDVALKGSETTGEKAELIGLLNQETTLHTPYQVAKPINKKTCEAIVDVFSIYGKDGMQRPGVIPVILSFSGSDGLRKIRQADGSYRSAAQAVLGEPYHASG